MAGASEFPAFTLMAVRGQVTDAVVSEDSATFSGVTMQLTLLSPFVFVLPIETVFDGQISMG
jgi:hypothetical protein